MTTPATGLRTRLGHPFWQGLSLLVLAFLLFKFGVRFLPPLIGIKSAPVPSTVLLQYMLIAVAGILIFVSDSDERWNQFKEPIHAGMVDQDKKWVRASLLVLIPLVVGFVTWQGVKPNIAGPAQLRSIHPANPATITVQRQELHPPGARQPVARAGRLDGAHRRRPPGLLPELHLLPRRPVRRAGPFRPRLQPGAACRSSTTGTIAQLSEGTSSGGCRRAGGDCPTRARRGIRRCRRGKTS